MKATLSRLAFHFSSTAITILVVQRYDLSGGSVVGAG